ncbi:MAG TPA: nuclear transport factor 2 family protein [Solirubrobacteraceae bacterium]|nr:nuclear transport factor 2 family protein [Solirubrobacteraceae bacterium]
MDITNQARLDELISKEEIRDVLSRFCRGVDRGEIELVRSCYHADAIDDHGSYHGGVDGLCAAIETVVERRTCTQHFLAPPLIELDGDRAVSESYVIAYHGVRPGRSSSGGDLFVGARYLDVFERRGGRWRIARRTVSHCWSRRLDAAPWRGADALTRDQRWPEDLLYRLM